MASVLYRASPIDTSLHPPSSTPQSHDLSSYNNPISAIDRQATSRRAGPGVIDGTYPTLQSSEALPDLGDIEKFGHGNSDISGANSFGSSLPGLSALASVASAPTSNLRYVT